MKPRDRIAIYLPKTPENLYAMFAVLLSGAVLVPVNPLLKPAQVAYILKHSGSKLLVTSRQRASQLDNQLEDCYDLQQIVWVDEITTAGISTQQQSKDPQLKFPQLKHHDLAVILYTSGSTGNPKGVMISQSNLIAGASAVSGYLALGQSDRLLAVLPFSFDYGLNQITSAIFVGASVALLDYLLPNDVVKAVAKYQITGLAAVPPLWQQLAALSWPQVARNSLRYFTSSGGSLPQNTLHQLRQQFPLAKPFLMYGLTEAFRSSYLDPEQIDIRPDSMGKAVPGEAIFVVNSHGELCQAEEEGELVHVGKLVSQGYWQDKEKTEKRFKPVKFSNNAIGVWSGDKVKMDESGFLYFISRMDDMIKTSGYRVSPNEIEAQILTLSGVKEAVALAAPHPTLGDGIVLLVVTGTEISATDSIKKYCQQRLANYMVPQHIEIIDTMPRNNNAKIDRALLKRAYQNVFRENSGNE